MVKKLSACLVLAILFASCATPDSDVKTEVSTGGASAGEIISYTGPKARIAVGSFDVKAGKAWGTIGDGMQEMLIDSLFKTNRFIVLESAALKDMKGEFELGSEGWAAGAPKKGTFETADIILTGAITAFEPEYKGRKGGGIVIPLPLKIGGGLKIEKKEAYIAASIRLVDVRTRRIIKTGTVEGYSSSSGLGIIGGGLIGSVALGAGYESYKNTPMEKAVMIMLENAISEIVSSVPLDYYRYTPEGKEAAAKEPAKTGLGIVGGEDRFISGEKPVFFEDFSAYDIGASPGKWITGDTPVEVALYDGKKWLRFLGEGKAVRSIKTAGDYSFEATVFIPDRKTEVSLRYGNTGEITIENGNIRIAGISIAETDPGTGPRKLEFSRRGERSLLFIDGKKVYASSADAGHTEDFTVSVKGIDTNTGKELLLTDIKVSEYK